MRKRPLILSTSELTTIATKTPQNVSNTLANTYKMVSPAGIDKVLIKSAAVQPMIHALLLIESFIIFTN